MSDRGKKESTPPHLLLMPPGGGLTLDAASPPNVLMPIIQSDSAFMIADEDGEADSFLGQSPPKTTFLGQSPPKSTGVYFQEQTNTSDPFAQVGHGSFTPLQHHTSDGNVTGYTQPSFTPTGTPPSTAGPRPPTSNKYRQQGPPRYAPSPIATYASASVRDPQVAPIPFTPAFSDSPLKFSQSPVIPGHSPVPSKPNSTLPLNPHGVYQPVQMHWCYCLIENNQDYWRPYSLVDSLNLEEAFSYGDEVPENTVVRTDGGRYDVHLSSRLRHAVYWTEAPSKVRRCSWFHKRENDGRYIPYSERFSDRLEIEYKNAVDNNLWHKRLEFEDGETIVMHNPNVIVHFQPSSQPDEWGTVQSVPSLMGDQMRPRVVKRGVDDFETINDGEPSRVDHLVFVVHGIGSACDMKLRSIVSCVDDFRTISLGLVKSHFKSHVIGGRVGRVEFLPVHWHSALHSDATGIDQRLQLITLRSTAKLREFVNDTLLDVLFYTSPTYCQTIYDTVTSEMNRLAALFLKRHPYFTGSVSVIGHSLGSSILFDILSHQRDPSQPQQRQPEQVNGRASPTIQNPGSEPRVDNIVETMNGSVVEEPAETPLTLPDLLSKVGLQDKISLFEQEQIDMDSIGMCSDGDLKDLGLAMGPRKKLQGLLKLEQGKKEKRKRENEELARREKEAREMELRRRLDEEAKEASVAEKVEQAGARSSISVEYLEGMAGTGHPLVNYQQLDFAPASLFALGSPIGVLLTVRGIGKVGDDYQLPTCPRVFNIYHPFDPVAYRIEPLLNPTNSKVKPVLIPHHKGRKRLHLELKEGLTRVGTDLKQRIISTLKTTWNSFNEFARAHRGDEVDEDVNEAIKQMAETEDKTETASTTSCHDEDVPMGSLNGGRRVDYVLQEKPIESFNDYLFALASHLCYWESEDTVLMVLKEIYAPSGIYPTAMADNTPKLPTLSPSPSTSPLHDQNHVQTTPASLDEPSASRPPPLAGFTRAT